MKHPTACLECRVTKVKCARDPNQPRGACLTCKSRNLECSLPTLNPKERATILRSHPQPRPLAPASSVPLEHENLASELPENIQEFIGLYLSLIHGRPHSLFHEQSLWLQYNEGSLPESLSTAICGLGCRLSERESDRNLAPAFIRKSKTLLAHQLEDITVTNIQTCILLANSYAAEQNHKLEALYFGIANRMAYVLELHKQHPDDDPIWREIKCRTWWSLFMADRWCPPGLGLPKEISVSHPSVELPMNELDFQLLRNTGVPSSTARRGGIWAFKITLVDILASIQDMNLSLVQEHLDRSTVDNQVQCIARRMEHWQGTLPDDLRLSEHNLNLHRHRGYGGMFVALHLGYHYYNILLYFQYLEPNYDPAYNTISYAAECRQHGLAFSRLLHTARELGDCHVVYLTVAHMTIVSSSVLLHLLLFGNDAEVDIAKQQLTRNFEALMDLAKYWPCVEKMKRRLFVFQDACLRSSIATYKVDRWIVRFLLEHALPFENEGPSSEGLAVDMSTMSMSHSRIPLGRQILLNETLDDLRSF
ncbi:NADH dehydrogenase [Paraphoma chrysanthemicola]|nr:NADH dehydrogenase [Paraphoma chrysanthemicola]